MNVVNMVARDLPDAWFQTVFKILDEGSVFKIDRGSFAGSKRLELDFYNCEIKYPGTRPLLPHIEDHFGIPDPVDPDYLDEYMPYLMTSIMKPNESYTYGQRLTKYPIDYPLHKFKIYPWNEILIQEIKELLNLNIIIIEDDKYYLNQIELLIWTYRNKGYRNNQMVLQIGHPSDMLLSDPPCLRTIDTRIQDGKLKFFVYFRSWSLWGGYPANLAAILQLQEYVSMQIGVECGEMYVSSKGLHLYDYEFDIAKLIRMRDDLELKIG